MTRAPFIPGPTEQARRARCYCDRPGHFAVRLIKNGPEVPLLVEHAPPNDPETGQPLDRSHYWSVWLNGKRVHHDLTRSPRIWIGRRIDEAEYAYLLADRAWAAAHAPETPEAQPDQAGDLRTMKAIF